MPPLLALWLWIEKKAPGEWKRDFVSLWIPCNRCPWEEKYTSWCLKDVCSGAVSAAASGKLWNTRAPIHYSTIYCQSMVVELRTESQPFLWRKREYDKFEVTRKWSLFQGCKIIEVSSSKCGEGTLRESGKIGRWKTAGHIHLPFLKESPDADPTSKVIFLSHVFQYCHHFVLESPS